MKIRDRLLLTFIIFIFLFGITGYLEHRHISKVTDSFQQLDDQIAPSLTSLLELITSIRRVSIKAMEFSIRGKPDDREKTEESITQINQQLRTFLSLHQQDHEQLELDELVDRKNHFIQVLNEYLQMTKGPAIEQVLGKQEELRKAHDELIAHINEALAQASGPVKNKLLLIRSAAQQATVKLMAFILLGNTEDLVKAQQAMDELESARNHLISGSANRPEMVKVVANQTQNYNMLARNYVRDMTSNRHALEDIFRKEEELHAARKALIHTLYPIIEHHYAALAQATNNTEKQLVQAGRLKIYSILSVSIIALAAALLLSYTISSPLKRLSGLVTRFGKGEKINTDEVKRIGGSEELRHLSHSVSAMMRERDSLNASIQENERFVRLLLDSSPVGLALTRMDGTLVDINPAFAAITGRSVEDTLGMNWRDITHEDYFDREQVRLDSLRTTGSYGPYEKEYLHRDGHSVPVRLSGRLIVRDGEQLIWSVVEDISLQKEAAAQIQQQLQILRQTEKRLAEAQRVAHIGTWELDIVENRLWWSDEIFNILEIDPAEFDESNETFLNIVHPDERKLVESTYAEAVAKHLPYQFTHRVLLKGGRIKYVHDRCVTDYDENGRPLRSIGTIQDVTESRLASEAMRKSEERYTLAARIGRTGVWEMWPGEGKIFFDENLPRLLGYEENELSEDVTDWVDTVPEPDRDMVGGAIQSLIDGHSNHYTIEHRVNRKDGSIGWVYAQGQVVSQPDDERLRIVGSSVDITERRQAEETLRLTQFSLDHAPEGVFWMQKDGSVSYANIEACRSLGYSQEEVIGMHVWDFDPVFPPERWPEQWENMRQAGHHTFETRHISKDGQSHPVEISVVRTSYEGVEHHSAFVRDITKRKEAEDEMRRNNTVLQAVNHAQTQFIGKCTAAEIFTDLLKAILELTNSEYGFIGEVLHSEDGMPYLKAHGITNIAWNEETRRFFKESAPEGLDFFNLDNLFGRAVTQGEMIISDDPATDPRSAGVPEGHPALHCFMGIPFFNGTAVLGMIAIANRPGGYDESLLPVLEPLLIASKNIIGSLRVDQQRETAEEALKKLNEELEDRIRKRTATISLQAQIIDQTHDSVITTDLEGYVTSWNGGAEQLLGIPADDAIGQHISFIYPEREHEFLQNQIIKPLKENGQHETEVILCRADGTEFPSHISLSLLYDSKGRPKGMVGYSLDISELKRREQELDDLAQRLQASNRELESFSYSVSHDLRAPLRAIDGFSLALLEDYGDRLDATAQDYLQRVRNSAQRMGMLIDDMLQLSRVNREELAIEDVDLGEIAMAVMEELHSAEPERHVELTLGQDLHVQGDPRLLRVMLDNLLANAWKFTSKEADAQIIFQQKSDQQGIFYISDNGVGFDMRHKDKLFGAFQRLHRVQDFPGTGVGLATVQRIVHRHGGRVWAEAHEGEGATFYFSLGSRWEALKQ